MAIAAAMNTNNNNDDRNNNNNNDDDDHELYDMVMPGFRFHPTEEELVEFYLHRKVEGKRFNVELITFLDLYRYDPWELPALAAIGEKEWYFYVPRDRKYRNGDRPNRVTTSGYWKATGADRMIRSENLRSIGLKKTLVFYSGKAPKGIRTSWIMNEYRLPLHETERLQKAEISLCRVYKRAGVEDHPPLPRSLPVRASSSSRGRNAAPVQPAAFQAGLFGGSPNEGKLNETSPSSSTDIGMTSLAAGKQQNPNFTSFNPLLPIMSSTLIPPVELEDQTMLFLHSKQPDSNCNVFGAGAGAPNSTVAAVDDLHKLVNITSYSSHQIVPPSSSSTSPNHGLICMPHHQYASNVIPASLLPHGFSSMQPQAAASASAQLPFNIGAFHAAAPWDWNSMSEASKDFTNLFK